MSAPVDLASHPTRITDEELFASLDLTRSGLESTRGAVGKGDYDAARKELADYLRRREQPTLHFSRAAWPGFIRKEFPQLAKPIVDGGEEIAQHRLAHATITIPVDGDRIVWDHNPTRDTAWTGAVGTPWFMQPVGRAYLLTGDERYARAFVWFFDQWYDNQDALRKHQGGMGFDPLYRAYYPGVRLRIFLDNYYCCAASPALPPAIHVKMVKQVLGSCSWLLKHNRGYQPGNQQVAAVVGLGLAGLFLPEFKDAEGWVKIAEVRMKEHLKHDFFADGGHKELCTQYHKTCLRDMAYVGLTAKANGEVSLFDDKGARPALERAFEWLTKLVMPTGETPPLHSAVFSNDWAVYGLMGARYFHRPDFRWLANRFWSQGLVPSQKAPFGYSNYLLTESMSQDSLATLTAERPRDLSVHLEHSGFALMRTGWEESDRYLVFQYGRANTGHAYPGPLHFLLEMNGEVVATGPGSPRSYRHPAYRYCHSTRSHNTVSIDLASCPSIGHIAPGGRLRTYADLPGAWYVSGSHEGYSKSKGAVLDRELLVIKDGPIVIRDRVTGAEGRQAYWSFHTPLKLELAEGRQARLGGRASYLLCPAFPDEIDDTKVEKHWMAVLPRDCQPDDCGKRVGTLRYVKPIGENGVRFCVALFEGEGSIEPAADRVFKLKAGGRQYLLVFGEAQTTVDGTEVAAKAECACIEQFNGEPRRGWVINGTSLTVRGTDWLSAEQPQSIEIVRD